MFQNHPVAIEPRYRTMEPNAPIVLYDGDAEVAIKGEVSTKHAEIRFVWLPSPRVEIQIADCFAFDLFEQNNLTVTLRGRCGPLPVRWTGQHLSGGENAQPPSIVGSVTHDSLGDVAALKRVLFHVANFPSFLGKSIRNESVTRATKARAELQVPP
jgi:hypothetical protein